MIVVFDLGGPLLAYSLLRSAGKGRTPSQRRRYRYGHNHHRQRRNVTACPYTLIRCLAR